MREKKGINTFVVDAKCYALGWESHTHVVTQKCLCRLKVVSRCLALAASHPKILHKQDREYQIGQDTYELAAKTTNYSNEQ